MTAMTLQLHPAPSQMVSLSCAWPMIDDGDRVGDTIVAEWDETLQSLPDEWMTYTVVQKRPLGPRVPKFDARKMDGVLVVEGLYNGAYTDQMLQSAEPILNLGKEHQLKVMTIATHHSSLVANLASLISHYSPCVADHPS